MFNIENFLKKFIELDKSNSLKLKILAEAIKTRSGVEIDEKSLRIKGDRVMVKSSPTARNEIMMHKEEIETDLKKNKIPLKLI
jgi:hypothetical protein